MNLSEFYDYKEQLMKDILTNERLVYLLSDGQCDLKHAKELAYKQVFPYEYLPDTLEHGKSYICFDVDVQKALNKTFLLPVIYVWAFTHRSKLRLPEGGVRPDQMAIELAKSINGSRFYGLGELNMFAAKRYAPLNDWQGKVLTFDAVEFNRTKPNTHPIPSNRKAGGV